MRAGIAPSTAAALAWATVVPLSGCGVARPPGPRPDADAATPPAAGAPSEDEDATPALVPLHLRLPKPAFGFGPRRLAPEVERPSVGPRPPVMVPAGTRNVALGRPVTASDDDPILGGPEMVTDGDREAGDGHYVELGPGPQHVTVDLGSTCELHAIVFWLNHADIRVCRDVVVRVAGDADFVVNARTLFSNDRDNSSGLGAGRDREYFETYEGRLVEARGARARYVRVHSNESDVQDLNRFIEVEVYGIPLE